MPSRNKISVAMLSLALMGLLLCHLATTASAATDSEDGSVRDGGSPAPDSGEGRVVYADMRLADSESSSSDAPASALAPSSS
ncbi:hypothetical protein BDA96_01G038400 [Sorghum bicolor]|uniref:Uncharacterized protein n=2 Tax=Sorghum bicolor TaxID=4558 RepID=A0A921UX52_SORBI|nr:uncharacterized protein LOC110431664 [Sorghum bicolor]KAG0546958.1 hypothetical protein BDA96_01G038400 [Sorghum bicolor]OQU90739.1 hypothetical protein SORBI_3001G037066 [Sorghum bicolor]|eukprot:XP_021306607.1 uncharacterized protein LOC110431664 [Sorghum bicolor]